MKQELH